MPTPTDSATAQSPARGIKAILDAAGTITDSNWAVKVGNFVDMPDNQIIIRNSGGTGEMAVAVDYPSVQILVRSMDYELAYAKIIACRDVLVGIANGGTDYPEVTSIIQKTVPIELGRDEKNRQVFSCNLDLIVSYDLSGNRDWT